MLFMECSAKSGQNIDAMFMVLTENINNKIEKGDIDPKNEAIGIKIGAMESERQISEKKKKCC